MSKAKHFLLKNIMIVDVEEGTLFQGAIEINHGFIHNVFSEEDDVPTSIETIDMEGKYMIPGLIDMHCHIKEDFAPHFVASGVTTVRNTAGNVMQIKNLIEAPMDAPTPRVYSADRMIDGPPGLWGETGIANFVTDDPALARKEVRRQKDAGAQFIKIYGWISKAVMEAVVSEANTYDLEVSCDLIHASKVTALDAAKAGVTWFEHASGFIQSIYLDWYPLAEQKAWEKVNWDYPDEEKIQALCMEMLKYNVKLCPTLIIFDQISQLPNYWHPANKVAEAIENNGELKDQWLTLAKEHTEALKAQLGIQTAFIKLIAKTYADLGGTVVAGTDTPGGVWTLPGMGLHRELELLVEIGFTEVEALQAATIKAAESIKMTDVGEIRAGNVADMVILNNNPLEDIRYTQDIDYVIKGGHMYTQADILEDIPSEAYLQEEHHKFMKVYEEMLKDND